MANLYQSDDRVGLSPSPGQHTHHTLLRTGDFEHDNHDQQYLGLQNILLGNTKQNKWILQIHTCFKPPIRNRQI